MFMMDKSIMRESKILSNNVKSIAKICHFPMILDYLALWQKSMIFSNPHFQHNDTYV